MVFGLHILLRYVCIRRDVLKSTALTACAEGLKGLKKPE